MGYNRIVKRNKIALYGKKSGKSRAQSLKQFSAFKKSMFEINSMSDEQIAELERVDIEKFKN